jgi:hypothetical protein
LKQLAEDPAMATMFLPATAQDRDGAVFRKALQQAKRELLA